MTFIYQYYVWIIVFVVDTYSFYTAMFYWSMGTVLKGKNNSCTPLFGSRYEQRIRRSHTEGGGDCIAR